MSFEDTIPPEHQTYWNNLTKFSKFTTENFEKVRFSIPLVIFVLFWGSSIFSPTVSSAGGLFAAILFAGLYLYMNLVTIPVEDENQQPSVALPVLFGERLPKVLQPGLFLSMPGMNLQFYQGSLINLDLTIEGVRTRLETAVPKGLTGLKGIVAALRKEDLTMPDAGGEVDVQLSPTIEVVNDDPWSLIALDQTGDLAGTQDIFIDAVKEDVRQIGRHLTWLELAFSTDLVSAVLLRDLTKRPEGMSDILDDPSEVNIRNYLQRAQVNGFSTANGLSIKVRRLNVTNVIPRGELATAAERAAVEKLKQAGLIQNAKALGEAVKKLSEELGEGHGLTQKELIDRIQIDEDGSRITKQITQIDLNDPDKAGTAIATALAAWASRTKS